MKVAWLAWLLRAERYGTELVPLEQKRNKQGWSKGRPVALKRLHGCAETLPWLLAPGDRQAARHIHYTAGYFTITAGMNLMLEQLSLAGWASGGILVRCELLSNVVYGVGQAAFLSDSSSTCTPSLNFTLFTTNVSSANP